MADNRRSQHTRREEASTVIGAAEPRPSDVLAPPREKSLTSVVRWSCDEPARCLSPHTLDSFHGGQGRIGFVLVSAKIGIPVNAPSHRLTDSQHHVAA